MIALNGWRGRPPLHRREGWGEAYQIGCTQFGLMVTFKLVPVIGRDP